VLNVFKSKYAFAVVCLATGLVILAGGPVGFAADVRTVLMSDACDPESFNEELGAGTCVRTGGVSFDTFISVLQNAHRIGSWHFSPMKVQLRAGQAFQAKNRGGEVHTFTEVDEFGGGIVEELNALSGNPEPAPECLTLGRDDFVAPGATTEAEVEPRGVHHYQCCIHPWMRADVVVR
jgi:plastocyanin